MDVTLEKADKPDKVEIIKVNRRRLPDGNYTGHLSGVVILLMEYPKTPFTPLAGSTDVRFKFSLQHRHCLSLGLSSISCKTINLLYGFPCTPENCVSLLI
jgi:hypothetical protein